MYFTTYKCYFSNNYNYSFLNLKKNQCQIYLKYSGSNLEVTVRRYLSKSFKKN